MHSPATSVTREFIFIRHGESVSNADLPTDHPQTILLTPKGTQQAQDAAARWQHAPDLFITSKYIRTQLTAEPFRARFPAVPHEEWDIHEFTHLDPEKYKGTTFSQRLPGSKAYWEKADPNHKDGPLAESFAEFAARCHSTLARMKASQQQSSVVFCHGFFIKGLIFALDGHMDTLSHETMPKFLQFHHNTPLDNCAVVRFYVNDDRITHVFDTRDTQRAVRTD